jgi:hypothetical protein
MSSRIPVEEPDERIDVSKYAAIATLPGDLEGEDAEDRTEFVKVLRAHFAALSSDYADRYQAITAGMGRTDRIGDEMWSFTQALAMLSEGAALRGAIDDVDREQFLRAFSWSVLGLLAVFTAHPDDSRTVEDLLGDLLSTDGSTLAT